MPKNSPSARSGSTPSKTPVRRGRPKTAVTVEGDPLVDDIIPIVEAARILQFDRGALYSWFERGCPRHPDGVRISEIVAWREAQAAANAARRSDNLDLEEIEIEIQRTKLESAQIDLAVKRRELLSVSDLEFFIKDAFATVRASLQTIAPRVSVDVARETDPVQCERMIAAVVAEVLDDLSSRKFKATG